jgi:hypothetical protein
MLPETAADLKWKPALAGHASTGGGAQAGVAGARWQPGKPASG